MCQRIASVYKNSLCVRGGTGCSLGGRAWDGDGGGGGGGGGDGEWEEAKSKCTQAL